MNAFWGHLSNAAHIDRVLADLTARPEAWDIVRESGRDVAKPEARSAPVN